MTWIRRSVYRLLRARTHPFHLHWRLDSFLMPTSSVKSSVSWWRQNAPTSKSVSLILFLWDSWIIHFIFVPIHLLIWAVMDRIGRHATWPARPVCIGLDPSRQEGTQLLPPFYLWLRGIILLEEMHKKLVQVIPKWYLVTWATYVVIMEIPLCMIDG